MEAIVRVIILIHVLFGSVAIIAGPIAAVAKKGSKVHRISGKIFAYSMIITAILALIVSLWPGHKSLFLFSIGIFGLYLVVSGFRVTKIKKLGRGQKASYFDWAMSITMGIFGVTMLSYGAYLLFYGKLAGLIQLVFGLFGMMLFRGDLKMYLKKPKDPRFWLFQHINKMNGGLITAFTALLVNNNNFMPGIFAWLLPTLIGSFLGTYWTRKYKGKAKKKGKIKANLAGE
ncbi:MAG: hypothetical protein MRZ79_18375 [Bacteroidia bacterium]|nr:hypothetical protein [Bacteroidia bacterium]